MRASVWVLVINLGKSENGKHQHLDLERTEVTDKYHNQQ
jgi:hypothetical protein